LEESAKRLTDFILQNIRQEGDGVP
jgi:hypothetical protein